MSSVASWVKPFASKAKVQCCTQTYSVTVMEAELDSKEEEIQI